MAAAAHSPMEIQKPGFDESPVPGMRLGGRSGPLWFRKEAVTVPLLGMVPAAPSEVDW